MNFVAFLRNAISKAFRRAAGMAATAACVTAIASFGGSSAEAYEYAQANYIPTAHGADAQPVAYNSYSNLGGGRRYGYGCNSCNGCYQGCQNCYGGHPGGQPGVGPDGQPLEAGDNFDRDPTLLDDTGFGAAGGPSSALASVVGYIDNAIVTNLVRVRYDHMSGMNFPDRASYFYSPKAFDQLGGGPIDADFDAGVQLQMVSIYAEYAFNPCFSIFGEVSQRWVDGFDDALYSNEGFGDSNIGFKYALIADPTEYLTFQVRMYIPTGDENIGLGNGVVAYEPAFLYFNQLSCRWSVYAELRDWISASTQRREGSDLNYAGNVLQFGVGAGYDVWQSCDYNYCTGCGARLTFVTEAVAWTVLKGWKSTGFDVDEVENARGDTICNIKIGGRYSHGRHSLYAGWGHALTDQRWYEDLARVEYRFVY